MPGLYRLSYSVWQEILLPSEILSPNMANGVQTSSGRFPGDTSPNIGGLTKDSKKNNWAVVKSTYNFKIVTHILKMKIPGDGKFYYRDFDTLFVTIGRVLLSRYVLTGEKCPVLLLQ